MRVEEEKSCSVDGCQMDETGVCALHNVEVERRKTMGVLVNKIPAILTRINWVLGVISCSGIALLGNYAYTNIIKTDLRDDMTVVREERDKADDLLRLRVMELVAMVNRTSTDVSTQAVSIGKVIATQQSLIKETERLNDSLEEVLDAQEEHEDRINGQFDAWGNRLKDYNGGPR